MTLALNPNALAPLGAVKAELELNTSDPNYTKWDDLLTRYINAVSDAFQSYCRRPLGFGFQPAQSEALKPVGQQRLLVSLTPLQSVTSITDTSQTPGVVVDVTLYSLEDSPAGIIYRGDAWDGSWQETVGTFRDPRPGSEESSLVAVYAGGWLLPPFSPATGWTQGTYLAGQVVTDSNGNAWGTPNGGATGGSQPAWPNPPTPGVTTVTDGAVKWVSIVAVPPTLPGDLQDACIVVVVNRFRNRSRGDGIDLTPVLPILDRYRHPD